MPLSARATTVEFHSFLSPPLRISLRTLQSFWRPQCPPVVSGGCRIPQCLTQRRSLVLYKTAKADTVLGMHKVLPFDRYRVAPPSASVHLVNIEGEGLTAKNISLQELYDNHIKPGQLLYLTDILKKSIAEDIDKLKADEEQKRCRNFGIYGAESKASFIKDANKTKGKGIGALRVTPVSLSSPIAYFQLAMARSYSFIKQGCPVEFSIRIKGAGMKKEARLKPVDLDSWIWIHNHFPHLRPDFILKSMPEGSRFVIDPVSDGRIMQFVIGKDDRALGPFPKGLTERLLKVKDSVKISIEKGQQAQLPKRYRAELQDAGNPAYSPLTGLPLTKKPESEAVEEPAPTWSDPLSRYLPEIVEKARPPRTDKLSRHGRLLKAVPQRKYARHERNSASSKGDGQTRGKVNSGT